MSRKNDKVKNAAAERISASASLMDADKMKDAEKVAAMDAFAAALAGLMEAIAGDETTAPALREAARGAAKGLK